jgi:hypothetical protein
VWLAVPGAFAVAATLVAIYTIDTGERVWGSAASASVLGSATAILLGIAGSRRTLEARRRTIVQWAAVTVGFSAWRYVATAMVLDDGTVVHDPALAVSGSTLWLGLILLGLATIVMMSWRRESESAVGADLGMVLGVTFAVVSLATNSYHGKHGVMELPGGVLVLALFTFPILLGYVGLRAYGSTLQSAVGIAIALITVAALYRKLEATASLAFGTASAITMLAVSGSARIARTLRERTERT